MKSSEKYQTSFEVYLKAKAFTKKGIQSRLVSIKQFWQWLDKENLEAEEISYNDLLLYMKCKSRNGASQRTIQSYIGTVRHFYEHLIQQEKITINPATDIEVKGIKRKVLYHILQPHELQSLYNDYKVHTPKGIRDKVLIGLLINQGLTIGELARLEVHHIKLKEGQIDVPGSTKSNGRIMQLESHQVMEMYDYILQYRPMLLKMKLDPQAEETELLFVGEGGAMSSFSGCITRIMVKLRKQNPNVLNAKQIRASVITKWLKAHNLREAQYLAGHRYISSTESYLENDLEGLQEEVQQYHPLG